MDSPFFDLSGKLLAADFSSLLEVAFGLNLAFPLLVQLHQASLEYYKRKKDQIVASIPKPEANVPEDKLIYDRSMDALAVALGKIEMKPRIFLTGAKRWSFFCALIQLFSLIFLGFSPEFSVSVAVAATYILFTVLPIPVISGLVHCYAWYEFREKHDRVKEFVWHRWPGADV